MTTLVRKHTTLAALDALPNPSPSFEDQGCQGLGEISRQNSIHHHCCQACCQCEDYQAQELVDSDQACAALAIQSYFAQLLGHFGVGLTPTPLELLALYDMAEV